jgi:putative NADH-flavin reductase
VATKVLHKKRPKLKPILDNEAIFGAYMNPKWPESWHQPTAFTRRHVSRDDSDLLIHAFRKPLTCNKPEDRSRPMNLTVLGATGPTGTQLVEQALAAGHHVTALARSPEKLTITNPNLHVVQGDATDRAAVSQAMKGADAVISTLGAKGSVIAAAARAIVAVAKQEGPQRIVMLSTFAVARDRLKAASKLLTGMVMGPQIKDKTAGEEALRASGLEWTIVSPPG